MRSRPMILLAAPLLAVACAAQPRPVEPASPEVFVLACVDAGDDYRCITQEGGQTRAFDVPKDAPPDDVLERVEPKGGI